MRYIILIWKTKIKGGGGEKLLFWSDRIGLLFFFLLVKKIYICCYKSCYTMTKIILTIKS